MYKITIKKVEKTMEMKRGEYETIKERLITLEEIEEAGYRDKQKYQAILEKGGFPKKREFGYPPKIETIVDKETMIFEQTVEDLDLVAVIKAINAIS